jgi:outer membrane protein OmpA-like peptidoglycan-associated protein
LLQKVFVIPNAQTVSEGTSLVSFTNLYQTTAFDASTAVSPSFGNTGFTAPSCNTSPSYSSTTAAGSYDITCSGGDGGSLYTFDFSYTNTLLVTANTSMPAAPTNLAVTSSTSSSASISFTPPTVPVSPSVTTYTVTATPIGGGAPITKTITAPASTATVSGLSSGTTYKFQIVANSSGGASLPATASLTTSGSSGGGGGGGGAAVTTPSAPSQVTALAVTSTGANSAIVSFVPAAGTSAGTTYTVTAFASGVATQITASGTSSPITISGLIEGTAYTFKVTATNSAGTSSASAASVTIVIPASTTSSNTTEDPSNNSTVGKSASLQVYFDSNASFVNAKPRREIKAFVAEMLKRGGPFRIEVVGMVEPTRIQPIPVAQLSKARANSVARLLKAAGLKGKYEVKGGGLSAFRGPKSRYTQIVVTWTR